MTKPKAKPKAKAKKKPAPYIQYSPELGDEICEWIAEGKSLNTFCQQSGKPNKSSVIRWALAHDIFRVNYARAREIQAEIHVDSLVDTIEKCESTKDGIAKARLYVDTIKWVACKLRPRVYGEVLRNKHEVSGSLTLTNLLAEIDGDERMPNDKK